LVYSLVIKMMHGPANIKCTDYLHLTVLCILNSSRFYIQVKRNICSFSEEKLASGVNFAVKWVVQISLLSLYFPQRETSEPVTVQPTLM